jgi:hypothetical protein
MSCQYVCQLEEAGGKLITPAPTSGTPRLTSTITLVVPVRPGPAGHCRSPPGPTRRAATRCQREPAARGLARLTTAPISRAARAP